MNTEHDKLAKRIVAAFMSKEALDFVKVTPQTQLDRKWVGRRYAELKMTLPFVASHKQAMEEFVVKALDEAQREHD